MNIPLSMCKFKLWLWLQNFSFDWLRWSFVCLSSQWEESILNMNFTLSISALRSECSLKIKWRCKLQSTQLYLSNGNASKQCWDPSLGQFCVRRKYKIHQNVTINCFHDSRAFKAEVPPLSTAGNIPPRHKADGKFCVLLTQQRGDV